MSTIFLEVVRVWKTKILGGIDANAIVPYIPLLEVIRAARVRDNAIDMTRTF